jgi:hypothetical protein
VKGSHEITVEEIRIRRRRKAIRAIAAGEDRGGRGCRFGRGGGERARGW